MIAAKDQDYWRIKEEVDEEEEKVPLYQPP